MQFCCVKQPREFYLTCRWIRTLYKFLYYYYY